MVESIYAAPKDEIRPTCDHPKNEGEITVYLCDYPIENYEALEGSPLGIDTSESPQGLSLVENNNGKSWISVFEVTFRDVQGFPPCSSLFFTRNKQNSTPCDWFENVWSSILDISHLYTSGSTVTFNRILRSSFDFLAILYNFIAQQVINMYDVLCDNVAEYAIGMSQNEKCNADSESSERSEDGCRPRILDSVLHAGTGRVHEHDAGGCGAIAGILGHGVGRDYGRIHQREIRRCVRVRHQEAVA